MKKQKAKSMLKSSLAFVFLAAGCSSAESQAENFKEADKIAYEYIAAKVERDDDRIIKLLSKEGLKNGEEANLIQEGEHLYPNNEEKMKDRYEIIRYDNLDTDGELYYRVKYELPNNHLSSSTTDYIELVIENGEWKLNKPMTISNSKLIEVFPTEDIKEKGTIVHPYKQN